VVPPSSLPNAHKRYPKNQTRKPQDPIRPARHPWVTPEGLPWRVVMLVAGLEIRVLTLDGTQLRHLTLNPQNDYQPTS